MVPTGLPANSRLSAVEKGDGFFLQPEKPRC
jgi:hypothetical protein